MLWRREKQPSLQMIKMTREKVDCLISNGDMADLNSTKSVVILEERILMHRHSIKKNGMKGFAMRLVLVSINTRKGKHLIGSFRRQGDLKRNRR